MWLALPGAVEVPHIGGRLNLLLTMSVCFRHGRWQHGIKFGDSCGLCHGFSYRFTYIGKVGIKDWGGSPWSPWLPTATGPDGLLQCDVRGGFLVTNHLFHSSCLPGKRPQNQRVWLMSFIFFVGCVCVGRCLTLIPLSLLCAYVCGCQKTISAIIPQVPFISHDSGSCL